jgi:hypothetical protein
MEKYLIGKRNVPLVACLVLGFILDGGMFVYVARGTSGIGRMARRNQAQENGRSR